MKFSIILPSFNNLDYLKLCLDSIKKNSKFDHEIIVHVNIGDDGTKEFLNKNSSFLYIFIVKFFYLFFIYFLTPLMQRKIL